MEQCWHQVQLRIEVMDEVSYRQRRWGAVISLYKRAALRRRIADYCQRRCSQVDAEAELHWTRQTTAHLRAIGHLDHARVPPSWRGNVDEEIATFARGHLIESTARAG
jgi:hypothetical protein